MKNGFSIEIKEGDIAGRTDVMVNVQCDLQFLTVNLARAICEINKTVNKTCPAETFKVKNGFWLMVQDIVQTTLAEEVGIKNG